MNDVIPVVSLAMQHVNANASILSNYDIDVMTFNGRCMASVVMHKFINIITDRDFKVGVLCSLFRVFRPKLFSPLF